jgi:hypothetical protein
MSGRGGAVHHQELERLLAQARRKVRRGRARAALPCALQTGGGLVVLTAAAFALVSCAAGARGTPVLPMHWAAYVALLIAALVAPLLVVCGRAWTRPVALRAVAERLDLGSGVHNQIAIAESFAARAQPGPFAELAIADGLDAARRLTAGAPFSATPTVPWRRLGIMALVAVALHATIYLPWLTSENGRRPTDGSGPVAAAAVAPGGTRDAERPARPEQPVAPRAPTAAVSPGTPVGQALPATASRRAAVSSGGAAHGASAAAQVSEQPVQTSGEASGGGGSLAARRPPGKPRTAAPPRPNPEEEPGRRSAKPGEERSGGSPGAAGGLCKSPTQNNWSQRDSALADQRDNELDEPTPDEAKSSTQRGGVQPALKDRNAAPTRELGISNDQGTPGEGRGGPTPPKKSRGTASVVLGVPMPDFVRGRMGPGPTKVTQERVPPSAAPGEPAERTPAASRRAPEAVLAELQLPIGFDIIVRDYLVALHTQAAAALPPPASE